MIMGVQAQKLPWLEVVHVVILLPTFLHKLGVPRKHQCLPFVEIVIVHLPIVVDGVDILSLSILDVDVSHF
jgi:hypothetical protein